VVSQVASKHFLHPFYRAVVSKWIHIKAYFHLQDLIDYRHDPDLGIKKMITPIVLLLKVRKWFNDHSLISNESLFHRKSRDGISWRREGCNTPGVTVAATIYLQWCLQYLYSVCYSINLIQWRWCFLQMELDHFKSIWKFEFSNSCELWAIRLSLKIFRIKWSRFRPHFQNKKCSSQLVLQVCKVTKILDVGRYLFKRSK
jgi:hypothetical protein